MGDRFDIIKPPMRIANRTGFDMATFETNYFFSGIETDEKKGEKRRTGRDFNVLFFEAMAR